MPRTATVRVDSKSTYGDAKIPGARVWRLDRVSFRVCLIESSKQRRREHLEFLRSVPLLKDFTERQKNNLADTLVTRVYKKGDEVIKEGDKGDEFFFLKKGEASQGTRALVAGDSFGEDVMLTLRNRLSTVVVTSEEAECVVVKREVFKRVMEPALNELTERVRG